jgi:glycosyltransferase involved in cell wall biosynthesis
MENGVCNIAAGLRARGFDIHAACLERPGTFASRFGPGDRLHVLGKGSGFSLRATWNLARLLVRLRPHILHTHNLGPLIYAGLSTLGGRTARVIHGEHAQLAPWELEPRRLKQRHRLYRGCRAIHTVSKGQMDELVARGFSAKKLSSIPNGVDTERFSPKGKAAAKAALEIPQDALTIGLVGRFGPFKRHDALLTAFESISLPHPAARLVFVGAGGSEEARIRSLAGAHPRVVFTGFRADSEACYRALDLLVIPSSNEGMSNAALEAMACGIPVLGNIGCGHEEIISTGSDGIIGDLSSPAEIARNVIELLNFPERLVDMGQRARLTVETRFSISAMLDAYEQLYRAHAH